MRSIIIGTAGHIDHGKSTLVQALTGKDPDRLPEEKRRGITIDLGFADLDLGEVRVGFVDVPGHERFVKNMLAGVHGIDAVALVIAADEGVMPQTREHFDICRLLDVQKGLVVLTKSDLVEDELLGLVRSEAEELIAGSFLEGATILPVSARTKTGIEELRSALAELASNVRVRSTGRVTRLPIDRAFTMKGFGSVITGTLVSGQINEGDELELQPVGLRVRARGVQVHGSAVRTAFAGQRTAVNVAGVETAALERGMVLATPGRLRPAQNLDVKLDVLKTAPRAVRTRSRVRVHIGSAEIIARVRVLDKTNEIRAGESGFAQVRLDNPTIALHGDRFIIRSYSPAETIGGGTILDPFATKHRAKEFEHTREYLSALASGDLPLALSTFIASAGARGLSLSELSARTGWLDEVLFEQLSQKEHQDQFVRIESLFVARESFDRLKRETVETVKRHHQREPLSRGLARETLRDQLFAKAAPELFRAIVTQLEGEKVLLADKDLLASSEYSRQLSGADAKLRQTLAEIYEKAGVEAPSLDQAFKAANVSPANQSHGRKILQLLVDDGTLVRITPDMFVHAPAMERLKKLLRDYAEGHGPERLIDVPSFKDLAGVSRKYAIPFLEYFDSIRVTRRAGDKRIIL